MDKVIVFFTSADNIMGLLIILFTSIFLLFAKSLNNMWADRIHQLDTSEAISLSRKLKYIEPTPPSCPVNSDDDSAQLR